jgi:cell wall-associated NlpC family hydrolase
MAAMLRRSVVLLLLALGACASTPSTGANAGDRAASQALKLIGAPYRYGGASPSGFDCSGLVQYSFRHAGVGLPHNTESLRRITKALRLSELRRGALLFFDQEGKKNSHVAIYVGDGEMVHAPSSGKRVRKDRVDSPYWRKHLSEVRRVSA